MNEFTSKERLLEFQNSLGIGQTRFEETTKIPRGYLSNKTTMPTTKILQKVHVVYPELSMDWLLFGEGSMLKSDNNDAIEDLRQKLAEKSDALEHVMRKYIELLEKQTAHNEMGISKTA